MTIVIIQLLMAAAAVLQGGPTERQRIDNAAADRGRLVYTQYCINCHGSSAKGTDNGPDLIRSVIVLRDRLGNGIGPAIRRGSPHQASLSDAQVVDLSHFIHQRIELIASNRNPRVPINVMTGNAEAGRAFFNGAGKCNACHSPSGDLAGIATRISPAVDLQQRFLFPRLTRGGGKQVEVTVAVPGSTPVSGALVRIDTFYVSLRQANGEYKTFRRAPDVKVEVRDPLAAHYQLLEQYTDEDMHNIVTYLGTLK